MRAVAAIILWLLVLALTAAAIYAYFFANLRFSGPARHPTLWFDAAVVALGLAPITFATVGALVLIRRPTNLVAWLFMGGALAFATWFFGVNYYFFVEVAKGFFVIGGRKIVPAAPAWIVWLTSWTPYLGWGLWGVFLFLLFPDGRLPSRRWRPAAAFAAAVVIMICLRQAFGSRSLSLRQFEIPAFKFLSYGVSLFGRAQEIVYLLFVVALVVAGISLAVRFRQSEGETRLQLKWLAFAAVLFSITFLSDELLALAGMRTAYIEAVMSFAVQLSLLLVPVAAAIAIFKYRLYDIDLVINRTITFGALALFITVAYVSISVGASRLVSVRGSGLVPSVLAMGLVTFGFAPVRSRTQRLANKIVYGARSASYEVLMNFSKDAATSLQIQEMLPRVARAAADGVGASLVVVRVAVSTAGDRVAVWPPGRAVESAEPDLSVEISYRGETIGQIDVHKKRGDGVSTEDRRLLGVLARQAGAAFQNARLTFQLQQRLQEQAEIRTELERSSRRLLTTQMSVRRSMEGEIDAKLGPHLARIAKLLDAASPPGAGDESQAIRLLEEAAETSDVALAVLREIAHGVFSPILEEKGIVAALESRLAKTTPRILLDVTDDARNRRFPIEVEAVMYFCGVDIIRKVQDPPEMEIYTADEHLVLKATWRKGRFDGSAESEWMLDLTDRLTALGGSLELTYAPGGPTVIMGKVPITRSLSSV